MRRKLFVLTAVAFCVLSARYGNADVIDNGASIIDTVTGLEWLDLTSTVNLSFNSVSAQLGPGGAFAGYQYATVDQVEALWTDAGILPGVPMPCSPAPCLAEDVATAPVQSLTNLLGNTWPTGFGFTGMIGLTSTRIFAGSNPDGTPVIAYFTPELRIYPNIPSEALIVEGLQASIADPAYGSWLVSQAPAAVPEPDSVALLVTGLFGLWWQRSRAQRLRFRLA